MERHGASAVAVSAMLVVLASALAACGGDDRGASGAAPESSSRVFLLAYEESDRGAIDRVDVYTVDLPGGEPQRARLPRLGIGDPPEFIEVTGGRLVYYGDGGATYSIDLGLSRAPKLLGRSWYFVPSTAEGRAWLAYLGAEEAPTRRDLGGVQEVTVEGEVTLDGRGKQPPCPGPTVVGAVRAALLCQDGEQTIAFDPRTGEELGPIPGTFPLATGGDLVASCDEPCRRLHVTDPVSGEDLALEPEHSFRWVPGDDGAFSPDASLLAVPVEPTALEGRPHDPRWLALVNVETGAVKVVGSGDSYVAGPMAFSDTNERLFFTTRDGALMVYRPGGRRAHEVARVDGLVVLDLAAG